MQRRLATASRSPLALARRVAARNRWLLRLVQERRQRRDEAAYVRRRERLTATAPRWLDWPRELDRQRDALMRAWHGPARVVELPTDARLFVAAAELDNTPTFVPELQRSFDAHVVNFVDRLPSGRSEMRSMAWRDRLQEHLLTEFHAAQDRSPIDLAILYVSHFECAPETLRSIRSTGVPVAVVSMDDKHSFEEREPPSGQRPLIGAATLHLTNSLECVRWYTAHGVAAYFFPEGADPEIYRAIDLPKDIPVSLVGGWYGARRDLITSLRDAGLDVRCWGPQTEGGPVSRDEMVRIFNRSWINLGFGGVRQAEKVTCLKTRDFEVPMTGNVYLTQYNFELTAQFTVGREILCYLNEIDCVEQIRFWLAQPERLREMGGRARQRAVNSATWTHRVVGLLRWMGIAAPAGDRTAAAIEA